MQRPAIELSRILDRDIAVLLAFVGWDVDFLVNPFYVEDGAAVVFGGLVLDLLGCFAFAGTALDGAVPLLF